MLYSLVKNIGRGLHGIARRYEFYVLVARTISHSFASLAREILFLPLEHKFHIFSPPCNSQINAPALIGQSAVGYCAGKPTEKSRVCWLNTRRIRKPLACGSWFTNSSRVLPTFRVVYQPITHRNLRSIA